MLNQTNNNLKKYLKIIESNFNINRLISEEQQNKQIRDYYLTNHLAYLVFHNRKGFMHMGLSRDNKYSSIDLSKKPSDKNVSNYRQVLGDFHNLNNYSNESFDLVFIIEALCHSTRKDVVLNEVYKKLRKEGLFIIFDGYANKPLNQFTDDETLAKKLTEKTMAVESFDFIDDFEKVIRKSHFSIVSKKDLSQEIIPSLKRFEKLALLFYKLPLLINLIKNLFPQDFVKNFVAGLLMPTLIQKKLACYYLHVLKKN